MNSASVTPVYPANWKVVCKSLGDASSERMHAPKSFACSGKKYETKCDDCFPIVDLIEKKHQFPCSVNGHRYTSTIIDGTNTWFYDCIDCNQCVSELSQTCSVEVKHANVEPVDSVPVKPADQPDLPPCCVHPHIAARKVEPDAPQMIHGLPAGDFRKAEEIARRRMAEEEKAEAEQKLQRNADYVYKVLKQGNDYEAEINRVSSEIAKEVQLLEKKKKNLIADAQSRHKFKLDHLRMEYDIQQ